MIKKKEEYILQLVENNKIETLKSLFDTMLQENNPKNNAEILEILGKEIKDGHTLLLIALKHNNEDLAKVLINYGANVNAQCNHDKKANFTPLHIALEYSMPNIVDLLLNQSPINVNLINFEGNLPLHFASHFYRNIIKESQISEYTLLCIIEKLINLTADINQKNYKGLTAFDLSVKENNANLCNLLLKKGAVIEQCYQLHNLLVSAIEKELKQIVEIMLKHLYEQNIPMPKDTANNNLLHIAAICNNIEIIEEILKYRDKIGINERNDASLTPLGNALVSGKIKNSMYLITQNPDIINTEMATIPSRKSYLIYVIERIKDQKLIEKLVTSSNDLNYQTTKGKNTASHLCIIHDDYNTFQLLMENGANPSIQECEGNTVLHCAVQNNNAIKYIETLLKREKKLSDNKMFKEPLINIKNNSHDTALHIAATSHSAIEIFHLLLKFPGINVNAQNKKGLTALHIAIRKNNNKLATLLIKNGAKISIKDMYLCNSFHHAVTANNLFMIKKLITMCINIQTEDVLELRSDLFDPNSLALKARDLKDGTSAITKLAIAGSWKKIEFLKQYSLGLRKDNNKNILWEAGKDLIRLRKEDHFIKLIKKFPYLIEYKDAQNLTLVHYLICKTENFSILNNIKQGLYNQTLKDSRLFSLLVQFDKRNSIILLLNNNYIENNDKKEESPLFTSLKFNKNLLEFLLTHNFNPNAQDRNGDTSLHLATQKEDMQSIKILLSFGAKTDIQNHKGETPLFYAVNNMKILKFLLEINAVINIKNTAGLTPLSKAAKDLEKNRDIVITLIDKAYTTNTLNELMMNSLEKINDRHLIHILNILVVQKKTLSKIVDKKGRNILHNIAISNRFKALELIIHQKLIDINAVDDNNDTALNLSIKYTKKNSNESIKLLIENDACINIKNTQGIEPLINAVLHERHDITEILLLQKFGHIKIQTFITYLQKSDHLDIPYILEKLKLNILSIAILDKKYDDFCNLINIESLDINQKDTLIGFSPMHYAVIDNFLSGVEKLLQRGAAIDQLDRKNRSALFYAIITKNLEMTTLLLSKGARIFLRDIDGESLLDHAVKNDFPKGIELLQQQSDDIDTLDKNLKYSLHRAIEVKNVNVMLRILSKPIDTLHYKCSLIPPLHYAVINDFSEGVNLLITHSKDISEDVNTMFRDKTPIMHAARSLNLNIFQQLLQHSDLSIKNSEGLTASDILMNSLLSEMFFVYIKKNIPEEDYILLELPKIKIDLSERGAQELLKKIQNIWETVQHSNYKLSTSINFIFLTENLSTLKQSISTIESFSEKFSIYENLKLLTLISPSIEHLFKEIIQHEIIQSSILPNHFTKQETAYTKSINIKLAKKDVLSLFYTFKQKPATHSDHVKEFIHQEIKTAIISKNNPILDHAYMTRMLHWAAILNNTTIVELIATKSNINQKTLLNFTPLFYGILYGGTNNTELVKKILALNANTNDTIGNSITPLHCTSIISNIEITKLLIAHGAEINAKTSLGDTTLMLSIQCSNKDNIEYLLSQENIDITSINVYGNNALLLAIERNDLHTTKLLLKRQFININHKNSGGISAITMATINDNLDLIQILFSSTKESIEVNIQDNSKKSPLFHAILNSNTKVVELLLQKGASVTMLDEKGMSALELCITLNNKELFDTILQNKTADIVTQCEDGEINIINNDNINPYFKEKLLKVLDTKKISSKLNNNPTLELIKIYNTTRKVELRAIN